MKILLTRPKAETERLIKALEKTGAEVYSYPLTSIKYTQIAEPLGKNIQGFIFTSTNGVRAFEHHFGHDSNFKKNKVFAVGRKTGEAALECGFRDIHFAKGSQKDLLRTILKYASPDLGILFHMAGHHLTGDLKLDLEKQGFKVERRRLYAAEENSFSDGEILKENFDVMAFYSVRAAEIFLKHAAGANTQQKLSHVIAICLSPAISSMLDKESWKEILTAAVPDEAALWKLVNITFEDMSQ